jgi:hypothetical protein
VATRAQAKLFVPLAMGLAVVPFHPFMQAGWPRRPCCSTTLSALPIDRRTAFVAARGLGKRLGSHETRCWPDFDVARGEVFALLRPSGCGKSTALAAGTPPARRAAVHSARRHPQQHQARQRSQPRSGSYPAAGSPCGGLGGPMAGAMRSLM